MSKKFFSTAFPIYTPKDMYSLGIGLDPAATEIWEANDLGTSP